MSQLTFDLLEENKKEKEPHAEGNFEFKENIDSKKFTNSPRFIKDDDDDETENKGETK